jgi:hypothetical protein
MIPTPSNIPELTQNVKEGTALDVLKRDPVVEGLICVISTVELCKLSGGS